MKFQNPNLKIILNGRTYTYGNTQGKSKLGGKDQEPIQFDS